MLTFSDHNSSQFIIAINNSTDAAELMSDFSYIEGLDGGTLTLDFTHMAAPLTLEKREDYTPHGFGYQPLQLLLEAVCSIAAYTEREAILPHMIEAILPTMNSKVGKFLHNIGLPSMLRNMGLSVKYLMPPIIEIGEDDPSRHNLIPLTYIGVSSSGPDFKALTKMRKRIESAFAQGLSGDVELANLFTSVVSEAVDNMVEYGKGGTVAGLYYQKAGEVEISLVNRHGKFGGETPSEELEALIGLYEGATQRTQGGGNGITELSSLALACFGSLCFRNGNAKLSLLPDGSITTATDETGFPTLGASATIVLQLFPTDTLQARNETLEEFKAVVADSINEYRRWRQGT